MADSIVSSETVCLRIGICDDEPLAIDYLTSHLQEWAKSRNCVLQLSAFSSAEQFLFEYEAEQNFDVLLLDIQMGAMNGMELARRIRNTDCEVQLVFISALTDYLYTKATRNLIPLTDYLSDGYEVAALHYLLKPVKPEKLCAVMDRAVQNLRKAEPFLLVTADQTTKRIPVSSIIYAEAFAHYIRITTKTETFELRENLFALEKKLGNLFVRPHRSYLVNLREIHTITKTEILLDNQQSIPLSRYNYQKINQAFIEYYKTRFAEL